VRIHSIHHMRSPSIPGSIFLCIYFPLPALRKAALMSIRSTPPLWPSLPAVCAYSAVIAGALNVDRPLLRPHWASLCSPPLWPCSASSSATTFLTTTPIQLGSEM
jgi:hypothetical protein